MANSAKVSHCRRGHVLATRTPLTRIPTSHGCRPHTDAYLTWMFMSKVLQSLLFWRADHLSWTSMTTSTCTQSILSGTLHRGKPQHAAQEVCWPSTFQKEGDPPALSRGPDGHAVPGALDQQLGVEAHLVPKAWQGAQAYFGEGGVHNFQPGWLKQGKGSKQHIRTADALSPQPPALRPIAELRSRGPLRPDSAGIPTSQEQLAAHTRHPCVAGTYRNSQQLNPRL